MGVNLLVGILIIFGIIFFLGKFTGIMGERLAVLVMALFILVLFFITLGYAFL